MKYLILWLCLYPIVAIVLIQGERVFLDKIEKLKGGKIFITILVICKVIAFALGIIYYTHKL